LIEFSVVGTTEFGTGSTKVMRAHDDTDTLSVLLHGIEHALWRQTTGGDLAQARHSTQKGPAFDLGRRQPLCDCFFYPTRNRDRPYASSLSDDPNQHRPTTFVLEILHIEVDGFVAAESTPDEQR
jgi:hypothetical protein